MGLLDASRIVLSGLYDDFARPDTAGGTVGIAKSGHGWSLTGAGIAQGKVSGSKFITALSNTVYVYARIVGKSQKLGGRISWVTGGGAGTGNAAVIITSPNDVSVIANWVHTLHFGVNQSSWFLQCVDSLGGGIVGIASGNFSSSLATDGTLYDMRMQRDITDASGNTVILYTPDGGVQKLTDSRIGACWGQFCMFELATSDGSSRLPQWDEVYAETDSTIAGESRLHPLFVHPAGLAETLQASGTAVAPAGAGTSVCTTGVIQNGVYRVEVTGFKTGATDTLPLNLQLYHGSTAHQKIPTVQNLPVTIRVPRLYVASGESINAKAVAAGSDTYIATLNAVRLA